MSIWSKIASYGAKTLSKAGKGTVTVGTAVAKGTATVGTVLVKETVKHPVLAGAVALGGWATFGGDEENTIGRNVGQKLGDAATGAKDFTKDVAKGFVGSVSEDQDVKDVAKAVTDTAGKVRDTAERLTNGATELVGGAGSMLGGVVDLLGKVFGGASNLLSGFTGGRMSGLGVAGLLMSAYLIFGRTGFLGKIGGLLMGMTLLSGLTRSSETASQTVAQQRGVADAMDREAPQAGMHR